MRNFILSLLVSLSLSLPALAEDVYDRTVIRKINTYNGDSGKYFDREYKGKLFSDSGYFEGVGTNLFGRPWARVSVGTRDVYCPLSDGAYEALPQRIKVGAFVKVSGIMTGRIGFELNLNRNCDIIPQ